MQVSPLRNVAWYLRLLFDSKVPTHKIAIHWHTQGLVFFFLMEYSHPFANQDFRHLEMHTMGAICGFGHLFSQCTFFGFVFLMLNMNNFSHWKNFLWISHTHFIGLINMTKKQNSITKKRHDGSKWTLPICINWNVVFRKKLVVLLFFFYLESNQKVLCASFYSNCVYLIICLHVTKQIFCYTDG